MLNIYFTCTENPYWQFRKLKALVVLVHNHMAGWRSHFWLNKFGIVLMSQEVQISEFTTESFNYICKINSVSLKKLSPAEKLQNSYIPKFYHWKASSGLIIFMGVRNNIFNMSTYLQQQSWKPGVEKSV